jgi:hypothetical protein
MRGCVVACVLLVSVVLMGCFVVLMERSNAPCNHDTAESPVLSVCLFTTTEAATRRALAELNWAFYPSDVAVELFIVGGSPIDAQWRHMPYHHVATPPSRFHDRARCVVALNDTDEVSPVFGFWFYHACNRATGDFIVSGGEAGLAFSGSVWGRWIVNRSSRGSVISPPTGHTFVRTVRQNPIEPERRA